MQMQSIDLVFIKGLAIGFAVAAPIGPVGLTCINRSLKHGFSTGIWSGVGASLADGLYALVAGLGVSTISAFLLKEQLYIRLIGGFFLIVLGLYTVFSSQKRIYEVRDSKVSIFGAISTTFVLAFANPMTIISFIGILAGLGLGGLHHNHLATLNLISGVFLGAMVWWFIICSFSAYWFKKRLTKQMIHKINVVSGLIIIIFGILSVIEYFR